MLALAGLPDRDPASALADGSALEVFRAMVRAQGGDPDAPLARAAHVEPVIAMRSGYLRRLDARAVGIASWRLGAGRVRKEDPVSAAAGVICRSKPGDRVEEGEPILELHTDDPERIGRAQAALEAAIEIGDDSPAEPPLVLERIH